MSVSGSPNIQKCPHCTSNQISPRKRLTASGYKTFFCKACKRTFNERTGTEFNDLHFPTDIVFQVLICRIRYKLSLREVAELFLQRGFAFTHETVREWEERFAPLLTKQLRLERKRDWRRQIGKNWHVDETYIRVKKQWFYLYRAIDNFGNLVDVRLSKTRDLEAAKAFFRQALEMREKSPEKVTTDKHSSYPRAIKKILGRKVEHRNTKYLNNFMEQDHRGIKARIKPMLGFKRFESAERFCQVFDEQRQYFRYREVKLDPVPLKRQRHLFKMRFAYIQKRFEAA